MSPPCCEGRATSDDDILEVLSRHEGEIVPLITLADELGLDEEELRLAITRLRSERRVKLSFDRETGDLVIGDQNTVATPRETPAVCASCGGPLPPGAHFCPNCGSSVIQPREQG